MRELLREMARYKVLLILPIVVLAITVGFAIYILSRPVIGSVIYRP